MNICEYINRFPSQQKKKKKKKKRQTRFGPFEDGSVIRNKSLVPYHCISYIPGI